MAKQLWIMRHGDAAWVAGKDAERPLTDAGRHQVRTVAEQLKSQLKGTCDVWISPYLRAQQSAQELLDAAQIEPANTQTEPMITPSGDPVMVASLIEASDFENLIIVAHMPLVARLTSYLTRNDSVEGFYTAQIAQLKQKSEMWEHQRDWRP